MKQRNKCGRSGGRWVEGYRVEQGRVIILRSLTFQL